jgi:hypothetical protein
VRLDLGYQTQRIPAHQTRITNGALFPALRRFWPGLAHPQLRLDPAVENELWTSRALRGPNTAPLPSQLLCPFPSPVHPDTPPLMYRSRDRAMLVIRGCPVKRGDTAASTLVSCPERANSGSTLTSREGFQGHFPCQLPDDKEICSGTLGTFFLGQVPWAGTVGISRHKMKSSCLAVAWLRFLK